MTDVTLDQALRTIGEEQLEFLRLMWEHQRDQFAPGGEGWKDEGPKPELARVFAVLFSSATQEKARREERRPGEYGGALPDDLDADWTPEIDPETGEPPGEDA